MDTTDSSYLLYRPARTNKPSLCQVTAHMTRLSHNLLCFCVSLQNNALFTMNLSHGTDPKQPLGRVKAHYIMEYDSTRSIRDILQIAKPKGKTQKQGRL